MQLAKSNENRVVEELLHSPRLALVAERLKDVLDAEQKRRERLRKELDPSQKAEFINGEVVMSTPARWRHNVVRNRLQNLLGSFVQLNDLGTVTVEKTLVALTRNDYEPDVVFFQKEQVRHFDPDQSEFPAPDFVCEVLSSSTEERDRGVKVEDYAAHGVEEYWIVDPKAETVEQHLLQNDEYELMMKAGNGEIASRVVAEFAIPIRALFDDEANRETLRSIL